jgi:PKD repeat protein
MKKVYAFILIFFLALSTNAQRIKSVSPNSGSAGQTLNVTITGGNTRFTQGSNSIDLNISSYFNGGSSTFIQASGTSNCSIINDTTIVYNIVIPSNVIEGYYDFSMFSNDWLPYGLRDAFYVNAPTSPKLKSVSPNVVYAGQTLNVTITGSNTNFTQGSNTTGINISSYFNGGSSAFYQASGTTNCTVINDTTIIYNLSIPNNIIEGYYDITMFTSDWLVYGLKNAFYINAPGSPKLKTVTPNVGSPGQTLNVTITGSNTSFTQGSNATDMNISSYFGGGSSTFYQGSGTTNFTVINDTTIIYNLTIPNNTIEGYYDVSMYTADWVQYGLRDAFYVNPRPSPLIKSVSPNSTNSGTTLNVTINCSNTHFTQASSTTIEFSFDPGNAVNSYSVLNDSQLVASLTIPSNIYTDDYDVYVSNDIDGDMNLFDSFHVTGSPCSINAGYSYIDNGNGNYSFNNSSTGNIVNFHWNFGDGTSSNGSSPSHTFTANGDYVVVLTVIDALSLYGYCYDYQAQLIHVTGVNNPLNCNAAFSVIPDTNFNKVYIFNCSTGNNLSYFWDFGDGNYSTNPYPNYSYSGVGPFNLCLSVNDGAGCSSIYCDSIGINGTVVKPSGFTINVNEPMSLGINNSLDGSINTILITPNPSNGFYNLEIKDLKESIPVSVYDLVGNVIYQKIIYSTKSSLDIRNLPSGVYFLKAGSLKPVRIIKK